MTSEKDICVSSVLTGDQISLMVETFYDRIRQDLRLGPIFQREIGEQWSPHLKKMKTFWSAVLLKTRDYQGRPVPAHTRLEGLTAEDFRIWLRIFRQVAFQTLHPEDASVAVKSAERIASSLWLAMNPSNFDAPPLWSTETSLNAQPTRNEKETSCEF